MFQFHHIALVLVALPGCVSCSVPDEHANHHWRIEGVAVTPDGQPIDDVMIRMLVTRDRRQVAAIDLVGKGPSDLYRTETRTFKARPAFKTTTTGNRVRLDFPYETVTGRHRSGSPSPHWLTRERGDTTTYEHLRLIHHPHFPSMPHVRDPGIVTVHAPDGRRIEIDGTRFHPPGWIVHRLYDEGGSLVAQTASSGTITFDDGLDAVWASILEARERTLGQYREAGLPVPPDVLRGEVGGNSSSDGKSDFQP